MKLSDLQASNYVKAAILGTSGAGKTIAALTFPGKKLIADFDNKISSAANFYAGNKEVLEAVEVRQYGKMPIMGDQKTGRKPRMKQFLDDIQELYNLQNTKQKLPYDTIVIDTLTTLVDSIMEDYRYVSQLGIKRPNQDQNSQQDYGLLAVHLKQIITGILSLDCHVLFTGHTQLMKDDQSGMITNEILMPGQMSSKLGIYFEEVYFAKMNSSGQYVWQTRGDNKTNFCRTQRKNLPAEVPASFAEIVKAR
jgi:hypothetical protein